MKIMGQIIPFVASLRKEPTFREATTGFPTKSFGGETSGSVAKCRLLGYFVASSNKFDKIDRKQYENNIKNIKESVKKS